MTEDAILIIEDNTVNLDIATFLLQQAGFETQAARSAEEGICLARETLPSLILMDLHLPEKDGYTASKELQGDPKTRHIPIVAYTALDNAEELQKAKDAGCIGVLSKPINATTFALDIQSYLSAHNSPASQQAKQTEQTVCTQPTHTPEQRQMQHLLHDIKNYLAGELTMLGLLKQEKLGKLSPQQMTFVNDIIDANQAVRKQISQWQSSAYEEVAHD